MTPDKRRINHAVRALRTCPSYEDEKPQTLLIDLLADLQHWAKATEGVDFDDAARIARDHFRAETREIVGFRLAYISTNRNSFGLRGAIMVAENGSTWEVGVHDLDCPRPGKTYRVTVQDNGTDANWSAFGWEIPRRLPQAPPEVVKEAWKP